MKGTVKVQFDNELLMVPINPFIFSFRRYNDTRYFQIMRSLIERSGDAQASLFVALFLSTVNNEDCHCMADADKVLRSAHRQVPLYFSIFTDFYKLHSTVFI